MRGRWRHRREYWHGRWHHHGHHPGHPFHARSGLRRRIFGWFAGAIITTALLLVGVFFVLGLFRPSTWSQDFERGRAWVGKQAARVWDDPVERLRFAEEAAADFDLQLDLKDARGAVFHSARGGCAQNRALEIPIARDGALLGSIAVCQMPGSRAQPSRLLIALVCVVAGLWMATGRIARRLSRPLDELAQVARDIGQGNFKARAGTSCHQPDEFGLVAEAMNDMAARIERQLKEQGELLAAVSHEMRTPLARMRILTELGRNKGAPDKMCDDLDREVVEMDALVGQLLANARLEFGDLNKRALSAREAAAQALERTGLPVDAVKVEGGEFTVNADPTLLARALVNLLDNARKHGVALEGVTVRSQVPGRVQFVVTDKGPGFTSEQLENAFQPFQRANGSERKDGLGLGLSLVRRIAEAHGGRAWARNREQGGAEVGFELSA